jgi:hypothetical protein
MKVICLLALLVLSSSAASIEPTLPPVEEPGYWGDWSTVYSSSLQGDYAICGAQIRFQGYQGSKDDTAANGVRFVFCSLKQWNTQNTQ